MKNVLLAIVTLLTFSTINAQEATTNTAQQAKFGLKAGLNISSFTGDAGGTTSKAGFHAGAFVEIKLSEKFALQPELVYSSQGVNVDYEGLDGDMVFELGYLNIPVMAKYYVTPKFNLEAGPQIGFLTSAKGKYQGQTVDIKDYFKSMDFGINIGTGYDFTDHVSAGLRYNAGLVNIGETPDDSDEKIGNGVWSLSLGYKF